MLGADSLNLAMMVAESGIIDAAVRDVVMQADLLSVGSDEGVKKSVTEHLSKWTENVKHRLIHSNHTHTLQDDLDQYQEVVYLSEDEFVYQFDTILAKIDSESPFYQQAHQLAASKDTLPNSIFARQFCRYWYDCLKQAVESGQQQTLDEQKSKLLKELYKRIETLKDMDHLSDTGKDESLGRLWDLAGGSLTKQDWKQIEQYSNYLAQHSELNDIANQLGRMAKEVDAPELNRAQAENQVQAEVQSDFATDDIVGIHVSNDINKLLPNETMYLAFPELETVFYQHLAEKRLLTYKSEGKQRSIRKLLTPTHSSGEADIEQGPIVIAVDASGSMQGSPEKCAKAMAYALLKIAAEQDRECQLILFSSSYVTYDFTSDNGLKEASDFLSYTFKGGTDFGKLLSYAVDAMSEERYINADLIVISDFIAPSQSDEIVAKVTALQGKYNRFHSLCLSKYGNPELMSLFDCQWRYHPSLMGRIAQSPAKGFNKAKSFFAQQFG
ncbi:ATPase RavA stimulator ViaA [Vibrio hippocampi]|uniref:Protein ViaA n=1 Tax=Vibrio hippocampi TaxID=654686 RepID=A0ABM8ZLJ3_9VIBR|nr:ATPase RavA stimulator ViaA [Vibrio hippocampi]CAH0528901.1 Protein ViaA [Vibrio hippocampi]